MQDIRKRMELNRQAKVLSAVGDYLSHKKKRRKSKQDESDGLRKKGNEQESQTILPNSF